MTDMVIPGAQQRPREGLRTLTHILYGLHTLSWFSLGVFSVVAMFINYVKRDDLPNNFYLSHFRWQSRSFWFTVLWLVLALPLWILVIPGWIAYVVIGLWYLYRFIRGWLAFADNRAMPLPDHEPGAGAG